MKTGSTFDGNHKGTPTYGTFRIADIKTAASLAAIGFTIPIFIANPAFGAESPFLSFAEIGILSASLLSGLAGWLILRSSR